jgi:hypothetical protein
MKTSNWQTFEVSKDETHHTLLEKPAYAQRFLHVLKFHSPGLAPVKDKDGAYHITPSGTPLYTKRYQRTFGYYCNRAAAVDERGWFHLHVDGSAVYEKRYGWCGNFQENLCTVRDLSGNYFHINLEGQPLYTQTYSYAGDFHDGVAVVQEMNGLHYHIDRAGNLIHPKGFLDLDTFHKGFARAKDEQGWFHLDRQGSPLYTDRYLMIEPFYNGYARVKTLEETLIIIDEKGEVTQTLYSKNRPLFHEVSQDLVSYWKLFTLEGAKNLHLFESLPGSLETLSHQTALDPCMLEKLLLALMEIGYTQKTQKGWQLTEKGTYLSPTPPDSLAQAHTLWMEEHFLAWKEMTTALKKKQPSFEQSFGMNWFDYIKHHPEKERLYHQALSHYAHFDYQDFGRLIDCTIHSSIADIGGSTGTLMNMLLTQYPHLKGSVLDRPSVLKTVSSRSRLTCMPLDFFETWPTCAFDGAILSRILHDWEDSKAIHILKEVRKVIEKNGRLYVIENLLDKTTGSGALLNLNMWIMTGGKERTLQEFQSLFSQGGFQLDKVIPLNKVSSIFVLCPL